MKIFSIIGTRPEVIKMAPVIRALAASPDRFEHRVVATAQHRQMLDQVLSAFSIVPDFDLGLMQHDQSLSSFASRSLAALSDLLASEKPACILIQGDTTTVMTAALAAFYNGIRVGHVEAGLRSFDRRDPFPEEINRRIAGCLADLHFAPTERARQNLLLEGIRQEDIFITGNTIVDALQSISLQSPFATPALSAIDFLSNRVLLLTAHRRENCGDRLKAICHAIKDIVARFEDVLVVCPVHLNPNIYKPVHKEIGDLARVLLVDPLPYGDLLKLMKSSYLILTDSGGIQEEAPSFHKPVLILREATERPEILETGAGRLVGADRKRILEVVSLLLNDSIEYDRMCNVRNPFGDGRAAGRIVEILAQRLLQKQGSTGSGQASARCRPAK